MPPSETIPARFFPTLQLFALLSYILSFRLSSDASLYIEARLRAARERKEHDEQLRAVLPWAVQERLSVEKFDLIKNGKVSNAVYTVRVPLEKTHETEGSAIEEVIEEKTLQVTCDTETRYDGRYGGQVDYVEICITYSGLKGGYKYELFPGWGGGNDSWNTGTPYGLVLVLRKLANDSGLKNLTVESEENKKRRLQVTTVKESYSGKRNMELYEDYQAHSWHRYDISQLIDTGVLHLSEEEDNDTVCTQSDLAVLLLMEAFLGRRLASKEVIFKDDYETSFPLSSAILLGAEWRWDD